MCKNFGKKFNNFFASLLNTYLIAAREKFQIQENGSDNQGAWSTLYYILDIVSKIYNLLLRQQLLRLHQMIRVGYISFPITPVIVFIWELLVMLHLE